jgi:hypothetical protein
VNVLAHILTAACSTVTQLWEGMRPGHIRGERATCLQERVYWHDNTRWQIKQVMHNSGKTRTPICHPPIR